MANNTVVLEPTEQGKALRERFEKAMKSLVVSEAVVSHATDPTKDVTWRVKGSIEREPGRSRSVDPFPGMPWPLWVPSQIEQDRKTSIVIPYLSTQAAVCRFKVPAALKPMIHGELRQENEFGKVFWLPAYDSGTRQVTVTLRVEVNMPSSGPERWEAFRTFLGWIETACRRQVTLVKEG